MTSGAASSMASRSTSLRALGDTDLHVKVCLPYNASEPPAAAGRASHFVSTGRGYGLELTSIRLESSFNWLTGCPPEIGSEARQSVHILGQRVN